MNFLNKVLFQVGLGMLLNKLVYLKRIATVRLSLSWLNFC